MMLVHQDTLSIYVAIVLTSITYVPAYVLAMSVVMQVATIGNSYLTMHEVAIIIKQNNDL